MASEVGEVVPAMQEDTKAAAEKYKAVSPDRGRLRLPGHARAARWPRPPAPVHCRLSGGLGCPQETTGDRPAELPAMNGTAVRDAMGFKFAEAPGQTAISSTSATSCKQADASRGQVQALCDPASGLQGKQVSGTGGGVVRSPTACGTAVPAAKPVTVQPVSDHGGRDECRQAPALAAHAPAPADGAVVLAARSTSPRPTA